jgi:hypothetical protein
MKKSSKNAIVIIVSVILSVVVLYVITFGQDLLDIQLLGLAYQQQQNAEDNKTSTPVEDDGTTHNITDDGSKYDILSDEQKQVVEIIESALVIMEPGDSDTIPVAYQGAIGDETFSFNINRYFREHYEAKGLGVVRMDDECDPNGVFQVYLTKY